MPNSSTGPVSPAEAQLRPAEAQMSPPYPPMNQILGGTPDVVPDIPIHAVFLALFVGAAALHLAVFQANRKRGKKFLFNSEVALFCSTRIIAIPLRMAWALNPSSIPIGIAAMIFVYAGIIILFIANLFFTERIIRAQHPRIGWSKAFSICTPFLAVILILTMISLIIAVLVQFYVFDGRDAARQIMRYGTTLYAVVSFLPVPVVITSTLLATLRRPEKGMGLPDNFGQGRIEEKIALVVYSALALCLGAAYRAATSLVDPIPLNEPQSSLLERPAFYLFNFTIEILVVFLWLGLRIDKLFHVPNGASGPGSYSRNAMFSSSDGSSDRHLMSRSSIDIVQRKHTQSTDAGSLDSRTSKNG